MQEIGNFYNLDKGVDSAKVPGTYGCLITIPGTGAKEYKVVASSAPEYSDELMGFWHDLVLVNNVKIVICLVGYTGGRSGCSQYWPTESTGPIEFSEGGKRIRVTLSAMETSAPALINYDLNVQ